MEMIKNDLRRAGFMATPNSDRDPRVGPKPLPRIHGLILQDNAAPSPTCHPNMNINITPDQITLVGNYRDSEAYFTTEIRGNTITLGNIGPFLNLNQERFERLFTPNTILRITNTDGISQFVRIQGQPNFNLRTIRTIPAPEYVFDIPARQDWGVMGAGGEHLVNVVNVIRYWIQRDRESEERDPRVVCKTDLMRCEIDITTNQCIPGTELVVAEFIIDFQVWFMAEQPLGNLGVIPDDQVERDDVGNVPNAIANGTMLARPENIRMVFVRVTGRAPYEDPRLMFRPRTRLQDPILTYEVDPRAEGSARVRTLQAEVELINFSIASRSRL